MKLFNSGEYKNRLKLENVGQQLRVLPVLPQDLSLVPSTYIMNSQLLQLYGV